MLTQIQGMHHVTSIATSAPRNNAFFTQTLGLRRVKQTVNFDNPSVYHLYYGDAHGTPGTVMTYFPFANAQPRRKGSGEIAQTAFAIPKGSAAFWMDRLSGLNPETDQRFGDTRVRFVGPDGDDFSLVEVEDTRTPWASDGIPSDVAIRGFHSVEMTVKDTAATAELLTFMGYEKLDQSGALTRFHRPNAGPASVLDVLEDPEAEEHAQGAGSVHHIAFAVEDRAAQLEVRSALLDTGYAVTPVKDRDYFHAIYFRSPGGILFEVATNEPGFDRDEEGAHLGKALKLPSQHEHRREMLEKTLEPLET